MPSIFKTPVLVDGWRLNAAEGSYPGQNYSSLTLSYSFIGGTTTPAIMNGFDYAGFHPDTKADLIDFYTNSARNVTKAEYILRYSQYTIASKILDYGDTSFISPTQAPHTQIHTQHHPARNHAAFKRQC